MNLTEAQCARIYKILSEPVHGKELYNKERFDAVTNEIGNIIEKLELALISNKQDIIDKVNDYLKENCHVRSQYFEAYREIIPEIPQDELVYRTAYGALIKKEAMCAGYTEAARMILECCGFNTVTVLSKLPGKNKNLLHYVSVIEYDCGSGRDYYIIDPEREKSCDEKGYDFKRYLETMTFIEPTKEFCTNKIGSNGVGPTAEEYINNYHPQIVYGKNEIDTLVKGMQNKHETNFSR